MVSNLMKELKVPFQNPLVLFIDFTNELSVTLNLLYATRINCIQNEKQVYLCSRLCFQESVALEYVGTTKIVDDVFTKDFKEEKYNQLLRQLFMVIHM